MYILYTSIITPNSDFLILVLIWAGTEAYPLAIWIEFGAALIPVLACLSCILHRKDAKGTNQWVWEGYTVYIKISVGYIAHSEVSVYHISWKEVLTILPKSLNHPCQFHYFDETSKLFLFRRDSKRKHAYKNFSRNSYVL